MRCEGITSGGEVPVFFGLFTVVEFEERGDDDADDPSGESAASCLLSLLSTTD
jgi:hypothetical protein